VDPRSAALAERNFQRALRALDEGNTLAALACLEAALNIWDDPRWYSRLGFCIARERGPLMRGGELCRAAMEREPDEPIHLLYLGKIHLLAGRKDEALQALRQGMALGGTPEIERLLETIGTRKPPVLPFLVRENLLNKYLGLLLSRLGLR
jgi:tetratricopeptide (TPR) repeat protein